MNEVFKKALTRTPVFNVFGQPNTNKLTYGFGEAVPVYSAFLHPGERIRTSVAEVTRFATLSKPIFHNFSVNFVSFFVPSRLIGYEDFFNPALNAEGELKQDRLPNFGALCAKYIRSNSEFDPTLHTYTIDSAIRETYSPCKLLDFLGVPQFPNARKKIVNCINQLFFPNVTRVKSSVYGSVYDSLKHGSSAIAVTRDSSVRKVTLATEGLLSSFEVIDNYYRLTDNMSARAFFELMYYVAYNLNVQLAGVPIIFDSVTTLNIKPYGTYLQDLTYFLDSGIDRVANKLDFSFVYFLLCYAYGLSFNSACCYKSSGSWLRPTDFEGEETFEDIPIFKVVDGLFNRQFGFSISEIIEDASPYEDCLYNIPESMSLYDLVKQDSVNLPSLYDIVKSYQDYLLCLVFQLYHSSASTPSPELMYDSIYSNAVGDFDNEVDYNDQFYKSYWKIIADWFIDTNFVDADEFYASKLPSESNFYDFTLFHRLWPNDYFTSCFGTPQSSSAVLVPTSGTIEDFWASERLQSLKEKIIWTGKRAIDQIKAIFGVTSSNARMDRVELLNYVKHAVDINSVVQTAHGDGVVGDLSGQGLAYGKSNIVDYFAEEHGVIMIIAICQPSCDYMQGMDKSLIIGDSIYDYIMPSFADLGEQSVLTREVFFDWPDDNRYDNVDRIFGWQRRYANFMSRRNEVHGSFLTSESDWHDSRLFTSMPFLGMQFKSIDSDTDNLDRIFAVRTSAPILQYLSFSTKVVRPLPKFISFSH